MARPLRLLARVLAAVALAAVALVGLASTRSASTGRLAPALPSERLGGSPTTLASLTRGAAARGALITFWASWCEPCAREAPALERFGRSTSGRGRLVGVDWSDELSAAREFIRRYSWTFPTLRDGAGTIGNDYGLRGLPTTFVLDAGGHIRAELRGPQTEGSLARALAQVARG